MVIPTTLRAALAAALLLGSGLGAAQSGGPSPTRLPPGALRVEPDAPPSITPLKRPDAVGGQALPTAPAASAPGVPVRLPPAGSTAEEDASAPLAKPPPVKLPARNQRRAPAKTVNTVPGAPAEQPPALPSAPDPEERPEVPAASSLGEGESLVEGGGRPGPRMGGPAPAAAPWPQPPAKAGADAAPWPQSPGPARAPAAAPWPQPPGKAQADTPPWPQPPSPARAPAAAPWPQPPGKAAPADASPWPQPHQAAPAAETAPRPRAPEAQPAPARPPAAAPWPSPPAAKPAPAAPAARPAEPWPQPPGGTPAVPAPASPAPGRSGATAPGLPAAAPAPLAPARAASPATLLPATELPSPAAPAPQATPGAEPAAAATPPAGPAEKPPALQGLLWKVARPGLAPNHLFGTLHLDEPRVLALPEERSTVRQALAGSRLLMLELLPNADDARAFRAATQLPANRSLSALAGPKLWERSSALLGGTYGLPREQADRLKPWAAYLFLTQPARPMGEILDRKVLRLAQAQGLQVGALETLSEQLAALDGLPLSSQLTLLDGISRDHASSQKAIGALVQHYLAENLEGMSRSQQEAGQGEPSLRLAHEDLVHHLVHKRNHGMVHSLRKPLERGGVFVAVGALHLHGEQGLPALLAREGWSVERVR